MSEIEDNQLVDQAVRLNDQGAFAELVNRHQSKVRYSLRQLTNWNESLADDLAQETFLQAFRQLSKFRGEAKFSSWLYRIAYNAFLQHVRKKTLDTSSLDEYPILETQEEPVALQDTGSDSHNEQSELHRTVAALLAQLEPERRSVLHLFLHRQHTQQEISEIMGIPLGTVKTHISRGRQGLQMALQAWR